MSELLAAYGTSGKHQPDHASTRSDKDREYDVVARVTREMCTAKERKMADGFPAYVAALKRNRDLWSLFSADLKSSQNGLPDDLKERLLSLAVFVRAQTSRALASDADISPLIEINLAILRGLNSQRPSK